VRSCVYELAYEYERVVKDVYELAYEYERVVKEGGRGGRGFVSIVS
jgi:hypothetical protein